jgi:hypothetical protein
MTLFCKKKKRKKEKKSRYFKKVFNRKHKDKQRKLFWSENCLTWQPALSGDLEGPFVGFLGGGFPLLAMTSLYSQPPNPRTSTLRSTKRFTSPWKPILGQL